MRAASAVAATRLPFQHRIAIAATALALVAGLSIAPSGGAQAAVPTVDRAAGQSLNVASAVLPPVIAREAISATDSIQALSSNGTNQDWAKLVLLYGGWPQTDENVTFMLRWMRQENGTQDWWNRNNPLNNGYGSGGGSGLGSYSTLEAAAEYCAANLQRGYPAVVAGLQAGTSADVTAAAIWASAWAESHYGYGSMWSTAPVDIVAAPASSW